jgi:hypothetical protein
VAATTDTGGAARARGLHGLILIDSWRGSLLLIPAGHLVLVGCKLAASAGWKPFLLVFGSY